MEWLRVRLPVRPNGTTGWVPADALSELQPVDTWLRISTKTFKITLVKNGKRVFSAPIGVGQSQWPTPKGQFYIRAKLKGYGGAGSFYGPLAYITSATSDHADRLARRRARRRPRHDPARADPRPDLARLRADEERRHPQAREAHAGRDADHDHLGLIPWEGRKRFAGSTSRLTRRSRSRLAP